MYDIFQTRKINHNLRSQNDFASNCVWNMVPLEIKNYANVEVFKTKTRNWEAKDC